MTRPIPNDCREARERLALRAEGRLDAEGTRRLDSHLAACVDCSAVSEESGNVGADLARAARLEPSDRLLARLRRIPDEVFPCHLFDAAAADALSAREEGRPVAPGARLAAHLETCDDCRFAFRTLGLAGTLREVGPRRELFRTLVSVPAEARTAEPGARGTFRRISERFVTDIRWTVAAAYVASMAVVFLAQDRAGAARDAFAGARSAAATVAAERLPDPDQARFQTIKSVARAKALARAAGDTAVVTLRKGVLNALSFASRLGGSSDDAAQKTPRRSENKFVADVVHREAV